MPVLAFIVAVVGGIAFWWWRIQAARGAADSVIDAAGKARGMISRARFKHRAGTSVLAGVDTPGMAAATLLYSLMSLRRPVVLSDEDKVEAMLDATCRMSKKECEDAMAFAAWASGQVPDTNEIIRRFLPLWANSLEPPQRQELVDMALQAAELGGAPTDAQAAAIKRLSEGLLAR
jgi:hypothetical protein